MKISYWQLNSYHCYIILYFLANKYILLKHCINTSFISFHAKIHLLQFSVVRPNHILLLQVHDHQSLSCINYNCAPNSDTNYSISLQPSAAEIPDCGLIMFQLNRPSLHQCETTHTQLGYYMHIFLRGNFIRNYSKLTISNKLSFMKIKRICFVN